MGERRLDAALKNFPHNDQVEIIYRCFELDPQMELNVQYDNYDKLAMKYGMSREQAMDACNNMKRQAQTVGLDYHFDTMVLTNTLDAHRLTLFAASKGKMHAMVERLFYAFFTESKHIGNHQTLMELAAEVGLDPNEVNVMLEGEDFTNEVRADEQEAMNLGVRGVPYYVINRKFAVSGAQSSEVFLNALERAWQDEQPVLLAEEEGAAVCNETGCQVPDKKE